MAKEKGKKDLMSVLANAKTTAEAEIRRIENGKKLVHLEQLSDPDYEKLLELQVRKKFLYSDYNEYGNKKSGIALEHARALQRLRNTLYGNKEANNDNEVDDSGKKKPVKREISKP